MDEENVKRWAVQPDVCRCCLSASGGRDATAAYMSRSGLEEVLADMLLECYGITLSHVSECGRSRLVCVRCEERLRDASAFREQVLQAERHFTLYCDSETVPNLHAESTLMVVKSDPEEDSAVLHDDVQVKQEHADRKREPGLIDELYRDHEIKEELVIGPEVLQKSAVLVSRGETNLPKQQETTNENENCTIIDLKKCLKAITSNKLVPIVVLVRYLPKKTERLKQRKTKPTKATDVLQNQEYCSSHLTKTPEEKKEQERRKRNKLQRLPSQQECISNRSSAGIANRRDSTRQTQQYSAEDLQLCLSAVKSGRLTATAASVLYDIPVSTLYRILASDEDKPNVTANPPVLKQASPCTLCGQNMPSSSSLAQHQCTRAASTSSRDVEERGEQTENKFTCDICKGDFKWKCSLSRHMMRVHEFVRKSKMLFTCKICNKQFSRSSNLTRHQRVHGGNKPCTCKICNKQFSRGWHLITHQRVHTGEKPYSCKICSKKFSQIANLNTHKRVHTGEKPYSCKMCNKQFSARSYLIKHQRIHTGEKPYSCKICSKKFSQSANLNTHKRVHTGEKPYSCKMCNKQFSARSYLIKHQRIHTGEKPYSCKICNKQFSVNSSLITHQRVHTGEKPYSCKICNKQFSGSGHLITHQRIHTGEKPYSCKICHKQFSDSSTLIKHQRIHTGEKPYSCKMCSKKFVQSAQLIAHQRIHTGEKPYSCKICNKLFSGYSGLITHERIHTGEKPYSCKICSKQFSDISSRNKHHRVHTGERPYSCKICSKNFSRRSHLTSHERTHSGDRR